MLGGMGAELQAVKGHWGSGGKAPAPENFGIFLQ